MSADGESFSAFSLHVAADTWVTCYQYPDKTPILSIQAGASDVSISIKDRNADQAAVGFARALARQVQAFAAEVERLHAANTVPDKSAVPAESADQAA
jgi:hypothetical protein